MDLHLMSHHLCPFVQRAVIALTEKGVPFERTQIELAAKPDWFLALSPLGKTPVLYVDGEAIFESAVIVEYLEDTQPNPLHPADPLARARHRAWIEVASALLNDIAGFYNAANGDALADRAAAMAAKFARLDEALDDDGPWFGGASFSLVDAAFGPVFRYLDHFDRVGDFGFLTGRRKVQRWRQRLAERPSVQGAVGSDYHARLDRFLRGRGSHLSSLIAAGGPRVQASPA